jgi:hypothetical protein
MASIVRLEPRTDCPEMQDSLQARIHDPLWLLARQWQFGEFKEVVHLQRRNSW